MKDPTFAMRVAAVRDELRTAGCEVLEAGGDGYGRAVCVWNDAVVRRPALVARCSSVLDVQSCLRMARAHGLPLSARGGGQDWVGRGLRDDGLVVDVSAMRQVYVDHDAREATIAAGASAADVVAAVGSGPLVAVTGNAAAIGMVGLVTGGGSGPLMNRFGLACDSLLRAELVLADGRVVQADHRENADLFWAIRGGGGNFGVVTSMRVRLHQPGPIMSGVILFPWSDAETVLRGYAETMSSAPDDLFLAVAMSEAPDGSPVIILAPTWTGPANEGQRVLARLQELGTPIMTKFSPTTFGGTLAFAETQLPAGRRYEVRTRWLSGLSPDAAATLIAGFEARTSPLTKVVLHHFHGAGARVAPDATAFGMRCEHFTALIYAAWEPDAGNEAAHRRWAAALCSDLAPTALPGGYANLLGPDALEQIGAAFGENGGRLRTLKSRFDPDDVFSSTIPLPG